MTEVVYAITIKGKLVYIGRTNNFRRRQCEHLRNIYRGTGAKKFRKVFRRVRATGQWSAIDFTIVYDGTRKQVKKRERELILKHRPKGNTEFLDRDHEKKKRMFM
jgi:predicted GIY-YIG superfamily endonuclease